MQAKQFLKVDWFKRVVFQPNLKYLHVGISFPWQPRRLCFAKKFPEWANIVYFNSVAVSTFRSEIVNILFRFWLHYLLFSLRKWTMTREDSTTTFMNEAGGFWERTHTYVRVNCHILTGGNISIVSCVFTSVVFCWRYSGKVYNFEISLAVFMSNILWNHANTYTNRNTSKAF